MMFRFSSWMALVTAGGILFSGCHSQRPSSSDRVSSPRAANTKAVRKESAAEVQARIEAQAHYATGVIHAMGEETIPALDEFYSAVERDPSNIPLVLEVSQNFIQAGQLEKALTVLEAATNQPEASDELFSRLGALYFQLNKLDSAMAISRLAIKKNPLAVDSYAILSQIYLRNKQPKEALDVVDSAAKVTAAPPELLVACGELYLRIGLQLTEQKQSLNARALAVFKQASAMPIDEPQMLLRLAEGFNLLGSYDEVAAVYLKLLKDFPELPYVRDTVRAKLADVLLRINDRQRAAELLKTMIRDNPTQPGAYYVLGNLSYEMTNLVQAAECYSKTILLNPNFEPVYGELAGTLLALNKTGEAQATLESGLKKFPRNFALEYLSGVVASRQKSFTNAIEHFTAAEVIAKATNPQQLREMFYFQLGSAYERIGDMSQAETNFLKCLQIAPDFDEAQNYLGFMWAEHGLNLDRARELIEKALKADPKNPAYLDSMAWVLFKLNQPQPALESALKAAANSEEPDAEIFNHLGDIYAALGQPDKARDAWSKSLKIEPTESVQKKLGVKSIPSDAIPLQ